MPPTGIGVRKAGADISLAPNEQYAHLAKTLLTLAGDLDDLDAQLKSEPRRKPDSL
jgi:hypothetical protein